MVAPLALSPSVLPVPGPVDPLYAVRAPFHFHPPHSVAMLVVRSPLTLRGDLAVISGPWVNPRHGRGPRYQVTALVNRGTESSPYKERVVKTAILNT